MENVRKQWSIFENVIIEGTVTALIAIIWFKFPSEGVTLLS